jgi:hypothetical protein
VITAVCLICLVGGVSVLLSRKDNVHPASVEKGNWTPSMVGLSVNVILVSPRLVIIV